jgi:hypothetical protein
MFIEFSREMERFCFIRSLSGQPTLILEIDGRGARAGFLAQPLYIHTILEINNDNDDDNDGGGCKMVMEMVVVIMMVAA